MRSMASTAVFRAVSKPRVRSVPGRSLSMVPGMPAQATPCSRCRRFGRPRKLPSPPMTTRASIPAAFSFAAARARGPPLGEIRSNGPSAARCRPAEGCWRKPGWASVPYPRPGVPDSRDGGPRPRAPTHRPGEPRRGWLRSCPGHPRRRNRPGHVHKLPPAPPVLPRFSALCGRPDRQILQKRDLARQGVIRLREFTQAEAEIFIDPRDKTHSKFDQIKDIRMRFYSQAAQERGEPDDDLWRGRGARDHSPQTLCILRRQNVPVPPCRGRIPGTPAVPSAQSDEMAHYAADCWDAEVLLDHLGWIETWAWRSRLRP